MGGSSPTARRLLWVGLLMPFIYSTVRTADEVAAGVALTPLDMLRGGGGLACLVVSLVIYTPPVRTRQGATGLGLLVFVMAAAASPLWAADPRSTLLKAITLTVAYATLVVLVQHYDSLAAAMTAMATAVHVVLLGLIVQLLVVPDLAYARLPGSQVERLGSIVPQMGPNLTAFMCCMGFAALVLKVGPAWTTRLPARPLLFAVYLVEAFATRSRTATIVGLGVVLAVVVRRALRTPSGVAGLSASAAGVLVALGYVLNTGSGAIITEFLRRGQADRGLSTLTGRTVVWERALTAWQDGHEFLGMGYYTGHRTGLVRYLQGVGADRSNIDSTWIESLVDVGLLGTFGLALFFLAGSWRLLRHRPSSARTMALTVVAAGIVVSFVNPTIQTPSSTMMLFGFCLLASGIEDRRRQTPAPLTRPASAEVRSTA